MSIASGQYIIECFYLSQIYETPSNISYHREKSINFNDISSASCHVQNSEGNKKDVLYDLNLLIVKINYWIQPIVFLPTGILWLSVSSSKFANYIAIVKEIGYFMNDPILIFCPLSRFKLCFVETQVFWRSRVIRYHLCSRHVFLLTNPTFPTY